MVKKEKPKCGMCKGVIFNRKSYAVYCKGCSNKLLYKSNLIRSNLRRYRLLLIKHQSEPKSRKNTLKIKTVRKKIHSISITLGRMKSKTYRLRKEGGWIL